MRDTDLHPASVQGATTTATDQRRLLRVFFTDTGPLSEQSRQTAAEILGDVAPEQAWGSRSSPGQRHRRAQERLVPINDHGGRWTVNSAGHVRSDSNEYLIVVLSDQHTDYASGIERVEHVAREATRGIEESLA